MWNVAITQVVYAFKLTETVIKKDKIRGVGTFSEVGGAKI